MKELFKIGSFKINLKTIYYEKINYGGRFSSWLIGIFCR